MKLTILQENLKTAVNLTSHFITNKVQLPILGNILLKAEKTNLILQATNLENSISIELPAKIEKQGEITVNGKLLNEVISNLKAGNIELEANEEQLLVTKDTFKSNILGLNSNDFPKVPTDIGASQLKFSLSLFKSYIQKLLFSVSNDETRPVLTGVLFLNSSQGSFLVSTDGFRLTEIDLKLKTTDEEFKIIIPKGILNEISKIEKDGDIQIQIDKENNQILFKIDNIVFSSRLIDGEFPDYKKIIPTASVVKLSCDKEEFEKAVKLASVFARDNGNIVKFKLKEKELVISAQGTNSGSQEMNIEVNLIECEKQDFEIMFNYRFIEESLKAITSDDVYLEFANDNKATKFLDTKNKNFLHIIMPIKGN